MENSIPGCNEDQPATIVFYNALKAGGFPVYLYGMERVTARIREDDRLGIVLKYILQADGMIILTIGFQIKSICQTEIGQIR